MHIKMLRAILLRLLWERPGCASVRVDIRKEAMVKAIKYLLPLAFEFEEGGTDGRDV